MSNSSGLSSPTPATRTLIVNGRTMRRIRRFCLRSEAGTTHTFDKRAVRVGSRPGNDLHLDDKAVSRLHFEIIAEDMGFRIRDLGSRNGTWVDGFRVVEVYLRTGCTVQAGSTRLTFELLEDEVEVPATTSSGFGPIVGASLPMREMYALLERAAPTDITLLVEGETGTGKELVAHAIHQKSKRAGGPFVVLDCGAVPANLLESELFGHEKGAFTGANARRAGLIEEAHEGTLFIDELGELPIELQPKLLRAIEQREVRRVGGREPIPVDIRIVAATNRDLAKEVNQGAFREDLFYRLAVVQVQVPPLRDRRDDIQMLAEHFIRNALRGDAERANRIFKGIDEANWERLREHPWPGNVRQLRNVIERTLTLSGPESVEIQLPKAEVEKHAQLTPAASVIVDLERPFSMQKAEVVADFERSYLEGQMARHDGNFSRAAAASGLDRMYFKRLLKKYR